VIDFEPCFSREVDQVDDERRFHVLIWRDVRFRASREAGTSDVT
jgi:hypothetical protein